MRTKTKELNEQPTELRILRLQYGISTTELAAELGMARSLYSVHEKGSRKYKGERYEEFYYAVGNALERIYQRKLEKAHQLNHANRGLLWSDKDDLEHLRQQMLEDYEEDDLDVEYPPITEDIFKRALGMLKKGLNMVQVAVSLGVCDDELRSMIGKVPVKEDSN